MVWPTLESWTAKEQNRTLCRVIPTKWRSYCDHRLCDVTVTPRIPIPWRHGEWQRPPFISSRRRFRIAHLPLSRQVVSDRTSVFDPGIAHCPCCSVLARHLHDFTPRRCRFLCLWLDSAAHEWSAFQDLPLSTPHRAAPRRGHCHKLCDDAAKSVTREISSDSPLATTQPRSSLELLYLWSHSPPLFDCKGAPLTFGIDR